MSITDVSNTFIYDHLWIIGSIILSSLLIIIVLGSIALTLSSLTTKKMYAGAGVVCVYLFSEIIAGITYEISRNKAANFLSLQRNLNITIGRIFDLDMSEVLGSQFGLESAYHGDLWWGYAPTVLGCIIILCIGILVLRIWRMEFSE